MSRLHLLKLRDLEARHSPELEYLLSVTVMEAQTVYDEVEVVLPDRGDRIPDPADDDHVLVIHRDPVLVGRRSLLAMRRALEAGRSVALPFVLSACRPSGWDRVFTLREFEEIESDFLASEATAFPSPASTHPAALFSARSFRERRSCLQRAPETAFAREELDNPACTGLQHTFIDYYGEVRRDVLRFVPPGTRSLLEVGCGRGLTGAWLAERLGCRVTGIELNPAVAADAESRLHRVITGDVAKIELDDRFDVVLALELFEHLPEPEPVLRALGDCLEPGGRIVLSVPNVGHYSLVRDLLAGRWDYLPIGLLCYTHYRFFTRKTLADWIRRFGFERFELFPQVTPIPEEMTSAPGLEIDRESLAAKGFYVVIESRHAPVATQ